MSAERTLKRLDRLSTLLRHSSAPSRRRLSRAPTRAGRWLAAAAFLLLCSPSEMLPRTVQAGEAASEPEGLPANRPSASSSHSASESASDEAQALWSFRPVVRPSTPAAQQAEWIRNPIDAFILERLEKRQLAPALPADRATLIRRVHLTLHGLPPAVETMIRWMGEQRDDWYERLVDELLASPRYGERWAAHWLDLVRYADSAGFETNRPRPNAYPFRDYIIRAFNEDLPYDQFVIEQLAGDASGVDAATGFLVAGPHDIVAGRNRELALMQRSDELADLLNATTTALLGLTVACARCHDHKFDPITQHDYYAAEAVFSGVQHAERPLRPEAYARLTATIEAATARLAELEKEIGQSLANASIEPIDLAGLSYDGPYHGPYDNNYDGPNDSPDDGPHRGPYLDCPTIGVDDEGAWPDGPSKDSVAVLSRDVRLGAYPQGVLRGQRDDPGDLTQTANVSGGKFRSWPGTDLPRPLFAWRPQCSGRYRIWLSWSAASHHAHDAAYAIDEDGDLATRDDRIALEAVDQRRFATGETVDDTAPRWSGFYDAGAWELTPTSQLVLSSGAQNAVVTADLTLFQADKRSPNRTTPQQPALRPPVRPGRNIESFSPIVAKFVRFEILASQGGEPGIDELEIFSAADRAALRRNVALSSQGATTTASGSLASEPHAHRLELVNDGVQGNASAWICDRSAGGWLQVELPEPLLIDRVAWGRDATGKFADRLATRYRVAVSVDGKHWQTVSASDDRFPYSKVEQSDDPPCWITWTPALATPGQRERLVEAVALRRTSAAHHEEQLHWPMAYTGAFSQPPPTRLLDGGDPLSPGDLVAPGCLSALGTLALGADAPEQQRRLAFARWLVRPDHPLTSRVVVNRLWQHHFGQGLVTTPSDFGENGARPSHPELLDFLASELIAHNWSLKRIQRLIVLSAAYRQSSAPHAAGLAVDAQNTLLWRFAPRRLEAEAIRDGILAASGELDLSMGGPGFQLFQPEPGNVYHYAAKLTFGPLESRRMIYAERIRGEQDLTFGAFDCPDGGQTAPRRERSTTPLQALNLLNSLFVIEQAEFLARRAIAEAMNEPDDATSAQIKRIFLRILQRSPQPAELARADELVRAHGLPALGRALFNANEFLFVF